MEESKKPPSAQELLRKIQEMEQREAHIKREISKLKLSANISKHAHEMACSHQLTVGRPGAFQEVNSVTHVRVMGPLDKKLIETQYLNILHSVGQAIYVHNYKHGIIFWNRAAENLYGITAAEAYGKSIIDLVVEPKDAEMAEHLLERMAHGQHWSGAFPVIRKNGERFVGIFTGTPYYDEYSRQLATIFVASDSRPYRLYADRQYGRDSQQPQQSSTASKIFNFVSKGKSKLKTGENYTARDNCASKQSEGSTPRRHIGPSPCEMLFPMDTEEQLFSGDKSENKCGVRKVLYSKEEGWMAKKGISWPWKELGHFSWHRYTLDQAHELGPQIRLGASEKLDFQLCPSGYNKIEALLL